MIGGMGDDDDEVPAWHAEISARKRALLDLLSTITAGDYEGVAMWDSVHGTERVHVEYDAEALVPGYEKLFLADGTTAEYVRLGADAGMDAAAEAYSEAIRPTLAAWASIVNDLLDLLEHEGPARDRREVIEMLRADTADDD